MRALRSTGLLGSPAERDFDDLARLAARVCEAPIAMIGLIDEDREFIKARHGIDLIWLDLDQAVCAHTILSTEVLVIEDTRADVRTSANRMNDEIGMRFYAGAPLIDAEGHTLGALCVVDRRPRTLTEHQHEALRILSRQVVAQIEMRRAHRAYVEALAIAEARSTELERALEVEHTLKLEIDHRVKNSLQLVGSLLQMQAARTERVEVREALQTARSRVTAISTIHGALNRSASINRVSLSIYLAKLVEELRASAPESVAITIETDEAWLSTSQASSLAILVNEFVTNSLKYAFPDGRPGIVSLSLGSDDETITAAFSDDGIGQQEPKTKPTREGLGTRIMEAVGQQLGAELDFQSGSGGTRLAFSFPLHQKMVDDPVD